MLLSRTGSFRAVWRVGRRREKNATGRSVVYQTPSSKEAKMSSKKVVIVAGGSGAIGQEICGLLAEAGYDVALTFVPTRLQRGQSKRGFNHWGVCRFPSPW